MNDFTKEELEILESSIKKYYSEWAYEHWHDEEKVLLNKVKSMIDNYGEHENDPLFNALPVDESPKICMKCQRFYI